MFSARAASVVERVLSISLSIVPLDREVGRCRSIARSIRRLLPRFEDGPAFSTLASLGDKRSGATHGRGHCRMSCEEPGYLRR